jgi:sarcosine oxidase subunit delta
MQIPCPYCGIRDYSEFTYDGDGTLARPDPADETLQPWLDFVFYRSNPRGPHWEIWYHVQGCRQHLRVKRDTFTHEILEVRDAREGLPAEEGGAS